MTSTREKYPPAMAQAVLRAWVCGMTEKEIAHHFGIPYSAVERLRKRAQRLAEKKEAA